VLGDLCAGEIRQMRAQYITNVDWDTYIQKSIWKTASLIAAGTHSAPILNARSMDVVAAMKDYGLNIGICFQIVDDLLDYTGTSNSLGKAAGNDLAQGLITAPALFVLERKDAAAVQLESLVKTRAVGTPEGRAEALSIVRDHGGVEATIGLARSYAQKARQSLTVLAPSTYRDSLDAIVDWLLMRTN
jgi:all-trans-nonaprenyl-diphosphate synthase